MATGIWLKIAAFRSWEQLFEFDARICICDNVKPIPRDGWSTCDFAFVIPGAESVIVSAINLVIITQTRRFWKPDFDKFKRKG